MRRPSVTTIDPIDIALSHADAGDGSLARRLLSRQIDLVDAQKNEISVKNALVDAQLNEIRIKRLLWGGAVMTMLGLMVLLAIAIVKASQSHALIVEPFHVPASLEARGLDGATIANRLTDRFAVLRDQSDSSRAEESYANGGDSDIKIAIPNTGVSVGDVWRYLRDWLGHDRKIGGDVTIVGDQVEITSRITGGKGESFRASLADPTPAINAAADAIFKQTQPYRYALVVMDTQGLEQAIPLMRAIAEQGRDIRERAWGYNGWTSAVLSLGDFDQALLLSKQVLALDPTFGKLWQAQAFQQFVIGHSEDALYSSRQILDLLKTPEQSELSERGFNHFRDNAFTLINSLLPDDQDQLSRWQHEQMLPEFNGNSRRARWESIVVLARLGEIRQATQLLNQLPFDDPALRGDAVDIAVRVARAVGMPQRAADLADRNAAASAKDPRTRNTFVRVNPIAVAGYAEILLDAGRTSDAAKTIAPSRLDCYPCLVARGEVAAAQRDLPGAIRWFAAAARQGPSLPQADFQWGRMLAANGKPDAALAHFAVESKRAPGWYEPPFASGRILMAQNHFAEARAALEKAHAAAPKRADVMLALGRAQWLGGDRVKAKARWADARKLDLLEPDLAWLKVIDAAVKRAGKTY